MLLSQYDYLKVLDKIDNYINEVIKSEIKNFQEMEVNEDFDFYEIEYNEETTIKKNIYVEYMNKNEVYNKRFFFTFKIKISTNNDNIFLCNYVVV